MIDLQVNGLQGATLMVERVAHFEADQLLTVMGNLVRSQTVRHFEQEKGPAGPFAAWRPSTAARRGSGQILSDDGKLKGSIQVFLAAGSVEVGTNVFYGKFHQQGTRKMVARPFLGLTKDDADELEQTIDTFFRTLLA